MQNYDPLIPAITRNPYPYYAVLRDEAPVKFTLSLQGYAVSRWDDVVAAASAPGITKTASSTFRSTPPTTRSG